MADGDPPFFRPEGQAEVEVLVIDRQKQVGFFKPEPLFAEPEPAQAEGDMADHFRQSHNGMACQVFPEVHSGFFHPGASHSKYPQPWIPAPQFPNDGGAVHVPGDLARHHENGFSFDADHGFLSGQREVNLPFFIEDERRKPTGPSRPNKPACSGPM